MAQPLSTIIWDLVKSSRSIAHSDDFEGHKLIQTNSRQLFLLDLKILYWCPASRDHIKPLLVQPQISCNANGLAVYWQGYDLAWYKDMEAPCFPQPNLWLARCASRSWAALSKQQQAASKKQASSKQAASKQQASSKQARKQASKQQASSKQASQPASKQQASSSRQAAGKQQQASSNQRLPPWKNERILALKINAILKIELFPGARP